MSEGDFQIGIFDAESNTTLHIQQLCIELSVLMCIYTVTLNNGLKSFLECVYGFEMSHKNEYLFMVVCFQLFLLIFTDHSAYDKFCSLTKIEY